MELVGYLGGLSVKPGRDGALEGRVPLIFQFEDARSASQIAEYLNKAVRVTIDSLQLSFNDVLDAAHDQQALPFE